MSNGYSARNAVEREKLERLVARLTDEQMGRPAGGPGWTVGALLGHLTFWDQRALELLKKWQSQGIGPSGVDIDVVNDAMRPLLAAVPPRKAAELAVAAARAIDEAIDSLDAVTLERVESEGKPVRLDRAAHRVHHREQIEKAIS